MTTKTFDIQVIKTTISTRAGAHIVSDKLSARAIDLQGFGQLGYELISTIKLEGEGFVTLVDTFQRPSD
ncbi:hypothetical protein [Agromyces bauzanensis]